MLSSYQPFSASGYRLNVQNRDDGIRFWFEVLPDKLQELGGARGASLIKLMEGELAKKALCPRGYFILSDGGGRGYYYISGQCKK